MGDQSCFLLIKYFSSFDAHCFPLTINMIRKQRRNDPTEEGPSGESTASPGTQTVCLLPSSSCWWGFFCRPNSYFVAAHCPCSCDVVSQGACSFPMSTQGTWSTKVSPDQPLQKHMNQKILFSNRTLMWLTDYAQNLKKKKCLKKEILIYKRKCDVFRHKWIEKKIS